MLLSERNGTMGKKMSTQQAKISWFRLVMTTDEISNGKHFELIEEFEKISQASSLSETGLYFHRNLKDPFTSFFIRLRYDHCRNASPLILGFKAVPCRKPNLQQLIPLSSQR